MFSSNSIPGIKLSINSLVIICAFYIAIFGNLKFWYALFDILEPSVWSHSLFLISFLFLLVTLLIILLSLFSSRYTIKPVLAIVLIATSVVAYFMDAYGTIISSEMIQNVAETDIREAGDLFSLNMFGFILLHGVVPSLLLFFVKITDKSFINELGARVGLLVVTIIITTISVFWSYKDYTFVIRENRSLRYFINPLYPVNSLINYVRSESNRKHKIQIVFNDAKAENKSLTDKKTLLVLVVGETARASSFHLNGYKKNTTPQLDKLQIINFTNTSSCGTATAESLPCMFSRVTREGYDKNTVRDEENLMDALKYADIDTLWRENNSSCKGICERIKTQHMSINDDGALCNDAGCYDEVLLNKLGDYINNLKNDSVIVLHQMGSHGPAYYKRIPKEFAVFTPECKTKSVQNCSQEEIENSYDNTILYTDYFLSKVIALLKEKSDLYNTSMIYMSDHGESLGENGIYLHGLPYFIAPVEQTHIPFMIWLSEGIEMDKNIDVSCLQNNQSEEYSHDNLLHSVLGIMDVKTNSYNTDYDIFSSCRSNGIEQAVSVNSAEEKILN